MRNRDELRALALISEIGIGVAGPMVVCTGLGWWLDGKFGTDHWLVMIGLLVGLLGAGYSFYRLATAFPAGQAGKKSSAPPIGDDPTDENFDV
ncbi:MAG: AtpZ/AtpI family protein [Chloroflexota bacterium]|nr:AtpZ/AtpI family protein [Chloroflexota bacterium]